MKILKHINLWLAIFAAVSFASCDFFGDLKDFNDTAEVEYLSVKVSANNVSTNIPLPEELMVRFINSAENYEIRKTVTNATSITVDDIIPGIYTIKISGKQDHDGKSYHFNGTSPLLSIHKGNMGDITIDIKAGLSSPIIFKEIYWSGSKTPTGASYYYDQFYELYNNSNEVVYADGIHIANCHWTRAATSTKMPPMNNLGEGKTEADWVFVIRSWELKGSGTDYPMQPGESIVIAMKSWAHNKDESLNPNSLDLSGAEFEACTQNNVGTGEDGPAINMVVSFGSKTTRNWLTTVFGPAMVIFRPEGEIDEMFYSQQIGSEEYGNYYKLNPDWVLDGVECVDNEFAVNNKRLQSFIDAGATYVGDMYNQKSVHRKVDDIIDGRYVFQDTNNSLDDFEVMDMPMTRRYGVGVPSWNTWIKE